MHKNKSNVTWISLEERPPPDSDVRPRLLLRFRVKDREYARMGYYLGDDNVRILGMPNTGQLPLKLEQFDAWAAVDGEQLARIENAELG